MLKSMDNPFLKIAPAQYIDEPGIIEKCGELISEWGDRALICGGERALKSVEKPLINSLEKEGIKWSKHLFRGECCEQNIYTIQKIVENNNVNVLIGVGGGKSLDTNKVVAELCKIPIVTIPTIAATCAATTAISIVYNDKGEFVQEFHRTTNPNLVIVDPNVIANAPVDYLKSGILDSLAKYYEGRVVVKNPESLNIFSSLVFYLSEILYQRMTKEAFKAVKLVNQKKVGDSLVEVINLNIYLTGLIQGIGRPGFTGAAAHAIHNGLTKIVQSHELLHGIKVGYGIIVQLYLENRPKEEIKEVVSFFRQIGMEPSFKGLNLPYNIENINIVADTAISDPVMKRLTFDVSKEMIVSAIQELEKDISMF